MSPSERCDAAGLKGLAELRRITGQSDQTLINWSRNKPNLFEICVIGAAEKKRRENMPKREYSIEIHEDGDVPSFIKCDHQKQVAISKAKEWAKKDGVTGVWIHVFFPGDGQKMYLNPNGDYALTGDSWVGV